MIIEKQKIHMILFISKMLFVLILMTSVASAKLTLTDYNSRITIVNETISLSNLYNHILTEKGDLVTHSTYLEETEPGIWYIHAQIFSGSTTDYNGTLTIDSNDATKVYFTNIAGSGYYSYWCGAKWENVTISSWDMTANTTNVASNLRQLFASNSTFVNVTWDEAGQTLFGNNYYPRENIEVYDCYQTGWYTFTEFYGTNFTIDGFSMVDSYPVWNSNRAGIKDSILYNSTMKNIYINPFKTFEKLEDESTDSYGLQVGGNNNNYENIHVENTSYSGYNLNGYYNTYINLSSHNAAHNQIEGQARESIYQGIRVTGGTSAYTDSGWFTSLSSGANVSVTDLYVDNRGSGAGIRLLGETGSLDNFYFKNVTIFDAGIISGNTQNLTFENMTLRMYGHSLIWQFTNMFDTIIIDSNISSDVGGFYTMTNSDAKLINSNFVDASAGSRGTWSIVSYNQLDVKVIDAESMPTFNAEVPLPTLCINGVGEVIGTVYTGANGYLGANQQIYIADYSHGDSGYAYYDHNFLFSTDGQDVELNIDSDSTWYREDPNIPTYTITAIIPDDSTTGPQITGFAPSEDNPFTAAESKKFRIWTDESLTNMKWYLDGNLVASGTMEYNWAISAGSHTILFTGSNGNGNVLHTWEVTEGPEVSPDVPVEQPPTTSGTGLSFTPTAPTFESEVGQSTNFVVSSDQTFTSSTWYFNDEEVASGATTHTHNWNTAGTHEVRFDGTAAAGTISRTWTVTVPESANTGVSSVSIAPSSTVVAPGESFSLDVYIDPGQPLSGSQFNMHYSNIASASSVQDCGLFSVDGLSSTFNNGEIDNVNSAITGVYSAIVGSGAVSEACAMATVNMVAGSTSGIVDFTLSNLVLSDANSAPAPYDVSYASVLVDTAPEFNALSSITSDETESISFTVAATDAEGDDLIYSATSLPGSAIFDANTATFTWTPDVGDAGTYTAIFAVTDGYLNDSVSVTITVEELNNAPVITLFEPADGTEFEEGSIVDINVAGTDSDGQNLNYVIKINGDIVSTGQSYSWVTDYSSAGTHTITAIVSDGIDDVSSTHSINISDLHPRWDVNEDGNVNVLDITLVGQNYGLAYASELPRWDVNQDGTINVQDLSIVSGHFGETV